MFLILKTANSAQKLDREIKKFAEFFPAPRWVFLCTQMGLPTPPDGFAHAPRWVCPRTQMGLPAHPDGFACTPRWVCPHTRMGLPTHPDGFAYAPRWVCLRTQMGLPSHPDGQCRPPSAVKSPQDIENEGIRRKAVPIQQGWIAGMRVCWPTATGSSRSTHWDRRRLACSRGAAMPRCLKTPRDSPRQVIRGWRDACGPSGFLPSHALIPALSAWKSPDFPIRPC